MLLPVVPQHTAAIVSPSHVMPCCVTVEYRIAGVFAAYRAIVALLLLASPSCHCGMEGGQHWSLCNALTGVKARRWQVGDFKSLVLGWRAFYYRWGPGSLLGGSEL